MTDKNALIQPDRGQPATMIHLITKDGLEGFLKSRSGAQRAALSAQKFEASANSFAILPDGDSWLVVAGIAKSDALSSWCLATLADKLPAGTYRCEGAEPGRAMLGWMTAQYRFDRYRSEPSEDEPRILLTSDVKAIEAMRSEAEAVNLVRDLVNTPAEDMGPSQLEAEVEALAKTHGAKVHVTRGDMLERDFPMVHFVGRAATRSHAPLMVELEWGSPGHPRLAVIGKGISFDTGGLDIKPSSGMLLMKKDMGGAAHAIALARLIMESGLKVRLHLLIPTAENAVSANSFRPGDVVKSRSGMTVEITNTDAEGRLLLGDALTRAGEENPDLVIDFATLTGAARSALGPDLPALFTRNDETADSLVKAGKSIDDECWRLPLYDGYREYLKSDIADIMNSHANPYAGASVAALFLDKFLPENIDWAHFDTFAWRPSGKPGRPKGGDALGLRAAWHMLKARYT